MSLIAWAPSNLSSSASESPGKKSYESQSPWSAKAEKEDRTEQPVVESDTVQHHKQFVESSTRNSGWNDDKAWSSQEWKADEMISDRTEKLVVSYWAKTNEFLSFSHENTKHVFLEEEETHDGTVKPVVCPQRGAKPQQFVIGDDETELDLSLGSRSFLDRVNDQVRKRQKPSLTNVAENEEKHSVIWGMFMSVTLESAAFMGKDYSDNGAFHQEYQRPQNEPNVRHIFEIGV